METTAVSDGLLVQQVWREACKHIEIEESVALITPILAEHFPIRLVLVRRIDPARSFVETVGQGTLGSDAAPAHTRDELSVGQMAELQDWARRGGVSAGTSDSPPLSLVAPAELRGTIMAGPLAAAEGPTGVLILVAAPNAVFTQTHQTLLQELLEPFAVALANDWRLRETNALREAAEADKRSLLNRLGRQDISDSIVGAENGLRQVMERVELVSRSDVPVLILGETGSGKEVIARAIHARSPRASGPFLRVNCGAIPSELIDSELFGHERGSFTGAINLRKGWFERADGGTLFLDEIGELTPPAQVRLLRILQDGVFERVGGQKQLKVDVRIIAATHRDLHGMVSSGGFREDLWYRIAVFPIYLPPLRKRPEDIPALARHLAEKACRRFGFPTLAPTPEDIGLLQAYPWPGNVRELGAVIDRAAILGEGHRLEVAKALGHVPVQAPPEPMAVAEPAPQAPGNSSASSEPAAFPTLDEAMRAHIRRALALTHGQIEGNRGAARLLGINPHTLRARMRKLGVAWSEFRNRQPATQEG